MSATVCYDHLGNEFESKAAMCRHYGQNDTELFNYRVKNNWSLRDALLVPSKRSCKVVEDVKPLYMSKNECCKDHLGNYYTNFELMCSCWHMRHDTVHRRLETGFSLELALTFRNDTIQPDIDVGVIWVFDEPFATYNEVDAFYGFSKGTCYRHRNHIEAWLLSKDIFYVDGKVYRSASSICIAYSIPEGCFHSRLRSGMSVHDAVYTPVGTGRTGKPCVDHLGNEYESTTQMLLTYGISDSAYRSRIRNGWTVEEALTTPVKAYMQNRSKYIEANVKGVST